LGTVVTPDSVVYREVTSIGGGQVQQNTVVHLHPADLSVTQIDQTGTTQGQAADIHLTYGNGRVKGKATTPQQSGTPATVEIDTTIAPGTYDDNAINTLIPALPLVAGQTINFGVFESGK